MSTAVARTLPPEAPTHEELTHELRNLLPSMHLYNPAPDWVSIEHGGRTYWLPPDRGGEVVAHPCEVERDAQQNITGPVMVSGNGIMGLRDLWGGRNYVKGAPTEYGPLGGQAAWEVVKFMAEHHAYRGIIYLRGNETDEARKQGAKKAYLSYIRTWATEQCQARDEFVENWRTKPGNKVQGKFPPRPTTIQNQAREILDTVGSDDAQGVVKQFFCVKCFGYETDNWESFARHMKVSHGIESLRREDFDPSLQEKGARRVSAEPEEPEGPEDEPEDPTEPGRKGKRR